MRTNPLLRSREPTHEPTRKPTRETFLPSRVRRSTSSSCGCPVREPVGSSVRERPRKVRNTVRLAPQRDEDIEPVEVIGKTKSKCQPYIEIKRDEKKFAACNALAEELGPLNEPGKILRILQDAIGDEVVEVFGVITLDLHCRLRGVHITGRGEEESVMAPIKSTTRAAVVDGAHAVIIFHIHPSGVEAEPSDADNETTEAFWEAFETIEVKMLDHVILGGDIKNPSYYSYLEDGKLPS